MEVSEILRTRELLCWFLIVLLSLPLIVRLCRQYSVIVSSVQFMNLTAPCLVLGRRTLILNVKVLGTVDCKM